MRSKFLHCISQVPHIIICVIAHARIHLFFYFWCFSFPCLAINHTHTTENYIRANDLFMAVLRIRDMEMANVLE